MTYITGDTHGIFDRVKSLCLNGNTTTKDILIILGDVGINYYENKTDIKNKKMLSQLPITLFCIKGNHELYAGEISSYKEINYLGGIAYAEEEYPNLIFAKDGEIYNIPTKNGKCKAIVIGGAYSVDKHWRLELGEKWFPNEQPSEEVKKYVEKQLDKHLWEVDLVLSHTCPLKYEPREWFIDAVNNRTVDKSTEIWLDKIEDGLCYGKWLCGHYHGNKTIDDMVFLYNDIKSL